MMDYMSNNHNERRKSIRKLRCWSDTNPKLYIGMTIDIDMMDENGNDAADGNHIEDIYILIIVNYWLLSIRFFTCSY